MCHALSLYYTNKEERTHEKIYKSWFSILKPIDGEWSKYVLQDLNEWKYINSLNIIIGSALFKQDKYATFNNKLSHILSIFECKIYKKNLFAIEKY